MPLRPGRLPVCGACGATLPLDRPVRLSAEDFPASAVEAEVPVLVAFSAEWCGPCGWLKPYLKEVAASEAGRLLVFDVDVDEATAIARTHRIGSVPTVLLLHGGKEEDRSVGVEPHRIREMAVRFRGSDEPSEPG